MVSPIRRQGRKRPVRAIGALLGCERGNQQDRQAAALEHGAHDRRPARSEALVPAERNQVDTTLLGDAEDRLLGPADAEREPDRAEAAGAVARQELGRPSLGLVLRLVGEERLRRLIEDVQDEHVHRCIARELEHSGRRE